jgi:SAM-dependent methyltransferase
MDFDPYASGYRATVNGALRGSGAEVGQLAGYKARLMLGLMDRELGDPRALRVLDVGCGVGLIDVELAAGVGELHGADTSQRSLDEATRLVPNAHFRHFDGQTFPYPDGGFDFVFAVCVLHHVPPAGRGAFVGEMARVARPGGIVFVLDHNPLNPVTRYVVPHCPLDRDAVLLRRASAVRLLAQPGLRFGGSAYIAFWPRPSTVVERLEPMIGWLPAGAQYHAWATRVRGADRADPSRAATRLAS